LARAFLHAAIPDCPVDRFHAPDILRCSQIRVGGDSSMAPLLRGSNSPRRRLFAARRCSLCFRSVLLLRFNLRIWFCAFNGSRSFFACGGGGGCKPESLLELASAALPRRIDRRSVSRSEPVWNQRYHPSPVRTSGSSPDGCRQRRRSARIALDAAARCAKALADLMGDRHFEYFFFFFPPPHEMAGP